MFIKLWRRKRLEKFLDKYFVQLIAAILGRTLKPVVTGGDLSFQVAPFVSVEMKGNRSMANYTIPNDQAPINYSVSPIVAKDAEGEDVVVVETLTSSNPEVIAVQGDVRSGQLLVGRSGAATLTYEATAKVGPTTVLVKSSTANFAVTTGQPGENTGGDLVIEGLTPDPEAPPA